VLKTKSDFPCPLALFQSVAILVLQGLAMPDQ
jgi:hypothetical protein